MGTWYLYNGLYASGFNWYNWIQPALMVIAGVLAIAAAILLAMRRSAGWDALVAAITVIPVILAVRLVIVVTLAIGHLGRWICDGSLFARLGGISPASVAVTPVVLVVIGGCSLLGRDMGESR